MLIDGYTLINSIFWLRILDSYDAKGTKTDPLAWSKFLLDQAIMDSFFKVTTGGGSIELIFTKLINLFY